MVKLYFYRTLSVFSLAFISIVLSKQPHIVFIVADDLGWNDVGFNNPDLITPEIDRLARKGIILDQSYVQPLCTPSRSAFLTGYYPFKTGRQTFVILPQQPSCLNTKMTLLPQRLKDAGYATHMVGKWHLGFCNWDCTPNHRGFDSFFGFYNGGEDYYLHAWQGGYDFRDNDDVERSENGTYTTSAFRDRAVTIIEEHDADKPLFLYLPFQAPHFPLQVPEKYEKMYPGIQNEDRRKYCGMVTAMDDAIKSVVDALERNGLLNDTLIVFTSDNGGSPNNGGNNYPLRGGKQTLWEGGTRAAAFVHGRMLERTGIRFQGLMHAVDWFPTLMGVAGIDAGQSIDGLNVWDALRTGKDSSPRTEFVYNIDNFLIPLSGYAAIRVGDYKLIEGFPGLWSDWYKPADVSKSNAALNDTDDEDWENIYYDEKEMKKFYLNNYDLFFHHYRLFDVKADPTEKTDLADKLPEVREKLKERLEHYKKQVVPPDFPMQSNKADPAGYGGSWTPGWC